MRLLVLLAFGCSPVALDGNEAGPTSQGASFAPLGSRCTSFPNGDLACDSLRTTLDGRTVLWQTPLGAPPAEGWPLVIIYQGSLMSPDGQAALSPDGMWAVKTSDWSNLGVFADYVHKQLITETLIIKRLLDAGYAVITPMADLGGLAWDTNLPPWLYDWSPAPDNLFLHDLFAAIAAGKFGPLSATRWYATGVSSGGYMTSRMAVSYPGQFRALVIAAGSYATCGGGLPCNVPALPDHHPPTLFLHGGSDPLVPVSQMESYLTALIGIGCETRAIINPDLKHGWIPESPDAIVEWFDRH